MLSIEGMPWPMSDHSSDVLIHPSEEFNAFYCDEWLNNDWSRRMISDIQRIDVTDPSRSVRDILLPFGITPERLATGTKNLLLCKFFDDGRKFRFSMMGENCYKWLMEISDERDLCGVITKVIWLTENDIKDRQIYFVNTGFLATGYEGFKQGMLKYIYLGVWRYESGVYND